MPLRPRGFEQSCLTSRSNPTTVHASQRGRYCYPRGSRDHGWVAVEAGPHRDGLCRDLPAAGTMSVLESQGRRWRSQMGMGGGLDVHRARVCRLRPSRGRQSPRRPTDSRRSQRPKRGSPGQRPELTVRCATSGMAPRCLQTTSGRTAPPRRGRRNRTGIRQFGALRMAWRGFVGSNPIRSTTRTQREPPPVPAGGASLVARGQWRRPRGADTTHSARC
jgi:hypothetical protein